ncbi:HAD family phosphatase [Bacillus sp. AGMB 02131]|uniref:HAD family phosphatase n=1 Tax=Peribacillus faecalis TaxID=2772559 RepID=A0A927CX00_9BACI|nr:HAD-IIB family hydrolase [Peribacillus faecalis]MBD3109293.1 HAD family phosphatase [Peribacillus faecalis]
MNFVFDLDGTICFKGQPISDKILGALDDLTEEGHEVIFASARPIRDMLPVINKRFHNKTLIGGNGSLISKGDEIVNSNPFSNREIEAIMQIIEEFEATYLIDGEWNYAYTGPDNHPILNNVDPSNLANLVDIKHLTSIVKILFLSSNNDEKLLCKLKELGVFINKHSNENIIDISPKGINKWSAIKNLEIPQGRYIAFGNDANDILMFRNAFHTVMIGYHAELALFAKEQIKLEDDYEQEIVDKLKELSKIYSMKSYCI